MLSYKQANTIAGIIGLSFVGIIIAGIMTEPYTLQFINYYPFQDSVEFQQAVKDMAKRLGIPANWLMYIMWNETAHTFRPNITDGSAVGLIQFEPATAAELGTSTQALSKMTALQQLPYVEKYFQNNINLYGVPKDLYNAYLSVLYPAAQNQPDTYTFPLWMTKGNPEFFKSGQTLADFKNGLYANIPYNLRTELA